MNLSDLVAYAEEKHQIKEDYRWPEFPGFSALVNPATRKLVALLIREWDSDCGVDREFCDIKCGQDILYHHPAPYISGPFRMKSRNWVGVRIDSSTESETVFELFDAAIALNNSQNSPGFTIVLDNANVPQKKMYQESAIQFGTATSDATGKKIPSEILDMMHLYDYGDGSFEQKCKNFFVQGKAMENYEDDFPWHGEVQRYFLTYHDLRPEQLRGYFTWRTGVRKGEFKHVSDSLAYMYLYELLNGIGTKSLDERFQKMIAFEKGYVDSGHGDESMRGNIHRWMRDLAIVNRLDPETINRYTDAETANADASLSILENPEAQTDSEIFNALCTWGNAKIKTSSVIQKFEDTGKRLFAEVWKRGVSDYNEDGKNLFSICFGEKVTLPWKPLGNAVYLPQNPKETFSFRVSAAREFFYCEGDWNEETYQKLFFDLRRLNGLLHEADRKLRQYLKSGHPLKANAENAWATKLIDAVIEADKKTKIEATKPKVHIRFDDLDRIRRDAGETRESLLSEEEKMETAEVAEPHTVTAPEVGVVASPHTVSATEVGEATTNVGNESATKAENKTAPEVELLRKLLQGESIVAEIKAKHQMPEMVAEQLNEFLWDEIGDTAVECDGCEISIVEDYREDVIRILEEGK